MCQDFLDLQYSKEHCPVFVIVVIGENILKGLIVDFTWGSVEPSAA